ncbi:MAG: PIN domain-containing protein [Chloroflexi bacterium]|nr:PIN domain-containing protein [Ardenticatenaceae bacterium]MBL1129329.1 PIN domain-containing protein [Chloroflexota bacterium]NOG35406.1 PIN domain-containing protein [Chloroflexota bacterium]GIK58636.1 MAG: ribonuclease VapC [Chloroflexota bacterium]
MNALLDTGFLLAVLDADDKLHPACVKALQGTSNPILPDAVIPELAYMVLRELGYEVLITFLDSLLNGELTIEKTTRTDLARAREILQKYADSRIDFVDCVIAAMAERLEIQRILTVDRRHFSLFRPHPWGYFEIIPPYA